MAEGAPGAPRLPASRRYDARATLLPLPPIAAGLGGFLATYGLVVDDLGMTLAGAFGLAVALSLFYLEGRWSRAWVLPPGAAPSTPTPTPWWKLPHNPLGRYLCPRCGWRQDTKAPLCPRCGKRLVWLGSGPQVKS